MTGEITIDYTLAMSEGVGPEAGLSDAQFDALAPRFADGCKSLLARSASGELGFLDLPIDRAALDAVHKVRDALAEGVRDVLVLGIGGSSLGTRALLEALCPPQLVRPSGMRLHLPDNSDPWVLSHLLEALDPNTTAMLVVSKSGGTVETAAQMLIVRSWLERALGREGARNHICAITDPSQGTLRALASSEHWLTLPIPSNVGGRFSILTAVGLLPACLLGIDAEALLAGAAEMAARCRKPSLRDNPAGLIAGIHYLHHVEKRRAIHVMMPYADRLRAFAAWYVQLWAESLGKRFDLKGQRVESGPTPLPAVGATDQHAQMQLFMEGPRDKLLTFIGVNEVDRELTIPTVSGADSYLSGVTLGRLLAAEQRGTTEALASDGRPSVTLSLQRLNASSLGALLMLYEMATALSGELYAINAFDQPGVELGKRLAFGLLGRKGYEDAAADIERRSSSRSTRYRLG